MAEGKGAPAFSISRLDYWKFQLHYAEWSSADMSDASTNGFLKTGPYVGTITYSNVYPSPIKNVYPAGAAAGDDLKVTWP